MIRVRTKICLLILVAISGQPVRADEPNVLWGRTLDGWIAALRDKTGKDRRAAVIALGYFGPAARAAVPDLIDAVRQGPFKDEAVEAGLDRLDIVPFFIRYRPFKDQAVEALVQIGAGTR